jgi:hypothetical protein
MFPARPLPFPSAGDRWFRAYGAYLRNLVNNLKASKMNTLALTFAICLVPATAFLIWLFTPWGKKWSKEL